jgi:SAM-dependent methyltransferase
MENTYQGDYALEWALHEHITHALQGLLPSCVRAFRLKQVLDMNCRVGAWSISLALSYPGVSVTGICTDMLAVQAARYSSSFLSQESVRFPEISLSRRLAFDDNTFDFVHSFTTAPVVKPRLWQAILLECQRVLKPGGKINLVSLSLGPTSSYAWQRAIILTDELYRKQGFVFADMPGGSSPGLFFCRMLHQADFTDLNYKIHPVNFGGLNNSRGRTCCQYFLQKIQQAKAQFLAFDLISEADFDRMVEQQQRDLLTIDYCATGAVISAIAVKK